MSNYRRIYQRVISSIISGLRTAWWEFRAQSDGVAILNPLQRRFVEWNAERLGISVDDSQRRFESSIKCFKNGHSGPEFRKFNELCYDVFMPFFDDIDSELYKSYNFHSHMHFLRMLSYHDFEPDEVTLHLLSGFEAGRKVYILDFGCGLAQRSRWIASNLSNRGCVVTLFLADISTERKNFLIWLCKRDKIDMKFIECSESDPIPELPECIDICVATEFFEHVRNPIKYFENFNEKMKNNSWLITNIADHYEEYMHVSPDLKCLRQRVSESGFECIVKNRVFQKKYDIFR